MDSKTTRSSKFGLVLWVMLLFATLTATAQQVKVTGIVTDQGGEPLVGVSVKVEATGAVTDIDGKYSVDARLLKADLCLQLRRSRVFHFYQQQFIVK